jgi:hypothetical protein
MKGQYKARGAPISTHKPRFLQKTIEMIAKTNQTHAARVLHLRASSKPSRGNRNGPRQPKIATSEENAKSGRALEKYGPITTVILLYAALSNSRSDASRRATGLKLPTANPSNRSH